jgi:hypothetical protein
VRSIGLPLALIMTAGCGLKDRSDELTNAAFEAPHVVKRGNMVEVVATYKFGSNGKHLTYLWTIEDQPEGSSAELETLDAQSTRFMADRFGMYMVTLVVDDGRNRSAPVTHMIEAKNVPPVALVAEVGHTAELGEVVTLDASGSTDCDGDALTYRWYFDHLPSGSNAELSDPTAVKPTFIPDLPGLYAPRAVAFDGRDESEPHGVFVWAGTNEPPVAVAPQDLTVDVGQTVSIDGSASHDPDPNDDLLTYRWALLDKPSASQVALGAADQRQAELTPDAPGDYLIELVVKDELGEESAPDQVLITAR